MANEPNHGIVISFDEAARKLQRQAPQSRTVRLTANVRSVSAMAEAYQAVFNASPHPSNVNSTGDLSLGRFKAPDGVRYQFHKEGLDSIEDAYREVVDYGLTARETNAIFTHYVCGMLGMANNRIQVMAANGCHELAPLARALYAAHELAANATYALDGSEEGVK